MGNWFYIVGPIWLVITIILVAIAFKYLLKIPLKPALLFAIILMLIAVIMPRVIDYFSGGKK